MTDVKTNRPGNTDHVITPFKERFRQDYAHALERRLRSWPDHSPTGLLTTTLRQWLDQRTNVTAENVMGMLLSLAATGFRAQKGNRHEIEKLLDATDESAVKTMIARLADISALRVNAAKRRFLEEPGSGTLRMSLEAARVPALMRDLQGTLDTIPWDAMHDGHLVARETTRTLGIVRWSKAETAERRERVNQAMAMTLAFGPRANRVWADRRPVLMIDRVTAYTAKLVGDLWTADPSIAVILSPPLTPLNQMNRGTRSDEKTVTSNPFDAFEVPFLVDDKAWLRALLGIEHFPALLEPRLGGFTVTAATGTVDRREAVKRGRYRPSPAPVWMRTMAEIALLTRFDEVSSKSHDRLPPVGERRAWLERYLALKNFPVIDSFNAKHAKSFAPAILEAIVKQRETFLPLRDSVIEKLRIIAATDPAPDAAEMSSPHEGED